MTATQWLAITSSRSRPTTYNVQQSLKARLPFLSTGSCLPFSTITQLTSITNPNILHLLTIFLPFPYNPWPPRAAITHPKKREYQRTRGQPNNRENGRQRDPHPDLRRPTRLVCHLSDLAVGKFASSSLPFNSPALSYPLVLRLGVAQLIERHTNESIAR